MVFSQLLMTQRSPFCVTVNMGKDITIFLSKVGPTFQFSAVSGIPSQDKKTFLHIWAVRGGGGKQTAALSFQRNLVHRVSV